MGPLETSKVAAELAEFWPCLWDRQHLAQRPSFEQLLHVASLAGHLDLRFLYKPQNKHFCSIDAEVVLLVGGGHAEIAGSTSLAAGAAAI